jgi:phage FluMu protein Com/uncharacterized membrane protein
MPIELRCHRCQRLLRTADDSGGKQTKCPECGTILDIPLPPEPTPLPWAPRVNPAIQSTVAPVAVAGSQPTGLDIGDVFNRTWEIYTKELAPLIVGMLILLGVTLVLFVPIAIGMTIAVGVGIAVSENGNEPLGVAIIIAAVAAVILVAFLASAWLYGGFIQWILKIARGQPHTFSDIFSGSPYVLSLLGAGLLFFLATMVGYILCIVPGVIIALMFSQFAWLIVDRRAGTLESLSRSLQLTNGNKLPMFLLMLLAFVISGVANLVPFAFIFTTPFLWLLLAVTYLRLSGEETAADRRA